MAEIRVTKVVKRDGRTVDFDIDRIRRAVKRAMLSVGRYDRKTLKKVVDYVLKTINMKFDEEHIPHVEDIQDIVEIALVKFDLYEVAKAYILYRKERERIREEKKRILEKNYVDEVDKAFSINALRLMASRYLMKNEEGKLSETPKQMFQRVAALVVIPDILHDPRIFDKEGNQPVHSGEEFNPISWEGKVGLGRKPDGFKVTWNKWHLERMKHLYDELNLQGKMRVSWSEFFKKLQRGEFEGYYKEFNEYYSIMVEKKFLPNSPTLFNAGTRLGQLSACFVLDINDDMVSIMKTASDAAIIFQSGGGVGVNYSKLRPEGDVVSSTYGTACFRGDTRIITSKGLMKISELVRDGSFTEALTHDGWRSIRGRFDNGVMDVYRVVTEDGYELYVTPEHKFLTFDGDGNMTLKRLENLHVGEYLYLFADKADFKVDYVKLDADVELKVRGKNIKLPRYLDEDLAYLIGLIMADGHVVKSHSSRVEIHLNAKEDLPVARKVTKILSDELKLSPQWFKRNDKLTIKIDSTLFVKFLEKNGMLKNKSGDIFIPEQVFKSPLTVIKAFIAGYYDGDGSISISDYCRIQLKSISRKFIRDLQLLLQCLGIVSSVRNYIPKEGDKKEVFTLRIQTKNLKKKFIEEISEYSAKLKEQRENLLKLLSNGINNKYSFPFNVMYKIRNPKTRAKIQRDYKILSYNAKVTHRGFLDQILRLKSELNLREEEVNYFKALSKLYPNRIIEIEYFGKLPVYDLEVEETHLLVGNGVYTSNSGPVSFMRIIDTVTDVVKQGGRRRGANIGILEVWHPDIEKFIAAKVSEGFLENFNLSVMITPDFWEYYEKGELYPLVNPRDGKVWKYIDPKALFDTMAKTAWKTGDPGVLFMDNINRRNVLKTAKRDIKSTNPCVTGDTLISTDEGLIPISKLAEGDRSVRVLVDLRTVERRNHRDRSNTTFAPINAVFRTGCRKVVKIVTKSGFELKATPDHLILTSDGWIEAGKLIPGKHKVIIQGGKGEFSREGKLPIKPTAVIVGLNNRTYSFNFPSKWSWNLGFTIGKLIGDGWMDATDHICISFGMDELDALSMLKAVMDEWYVSSGSVITKGSEKVLSYHGKFFVEFFKGLGVKKAPAFEKEVPWSIFEATEEAVRGFLNGLFSSDGTILHVGGKSAEIRLSSSSLKLLKQVQLLLLNLGIFSRIYENRREGGDVTFKYVDREGETREYACKAYHELVISGEDVPVFIRTIGLTGDKFRKKVKLLMGKEGGKREYCKREFIDEVSEIQCLGEKEVYDLIEPMTHSFIANGIVVHNCGEEPLYPYESCNLGSVNLYALVKGGVGEKREFDWRELERVVRIGLRFLDNVIDVNKFPLREIEESTKASRKVGLGVMGLADTLFALGIPYNSEDGFEFMGKVMEHITFYAMDESVEISKRRGPFPLYFKSGYVNGGMPVEGYYHSDWWTLNWGELVDKIKQFGIRNAEVTTIAPTGSISMLADVSSGIEPQFALIYEKRVTVGTFYYIDQEFERRLREEGLYSEALIKKIADNGGSVQGLENIPEDFRKVFLVAYDIPWWDHVRAQAEFNKWTCAAVSKTINMPHWVTSEDVAKAYLFAHKLGLKGITIYREGSKTKQVLVTPSQKAGKYIALTKNKTPELMKQVGIALPTAAEELSMEKSKLSFKAEAYGEAGKKGMKCPMCGSERLIIEENCVKCLDCHWAVCTEA